MSYFSVLIARSTCLKFPAIVQALKSGPLRRNYFCPVNLCRNTTLTGHGERLQLLPRARNVDSTSKLVAINNISYGCRVQYFSTGKIWLKEEDDKITKVLFLNFVEMICNHHFHKITDSHFPHGV